MTPAELTDLREALAKATPGPWEFVPAEHLSHDAPGYDVRLTTGGLFCGGEYPYWVVEDAEAFAIKSDADLIALARNHLPDLLAASDALAADRDRLLAENARLRERLDDAPILSKYHGHRGFELERFIDHYDIWKAKIRTLLSELEGKTP